MRLDDFMYGGDMYGGDTFGADEYSGGYGGAGLPSFAVAPPPAYEAPSFAVDPYTAPPAYSQEDIQRAAQAFVEQQQRANALSTQNSDALNNYIAQQAAKGVEVASTDTSQGGGPMGSSGVFGLPDFSARFDPANPAASTGQVFRFDTGSQVGAPGASGEMEYRNAAPVVFQPGEKYIMTDGRGEKVLGSATTPEEMAGLVDLSGKLPYGFQLFPANEQGGFTPGQELFGKDDPRPDGLMGAIANYGIPLGMSLLAGPLGPLAAAAAAAGTTGVTKLTSGYTPKDALIAAAISGATAGALKGFTGPTDPLGLEPFGTAAKNAAAEAAAQGAGGALAQGAGGALAQGAGGALSQAIPSAGEIVVNALKTAAPSLVSQVAPSLVQAGVSGLSNALLPPQSATTQTPLAVQPPPAPLAVLPAAPAPTPEMIVTASRMGISPTVLSGLPPAVAQSMMQLFNAPFAAKQQTPATQPEPAPAPLAAQEPPATAVPSNEVAGLTVTGSVPSSNALPSLAAGLSGVGNLALKVSADQIAAEQQAAEQKRADEERMITVTSTTPPPSSAIAPSLAVPAMAALPSLAAATAQPTPATTTAPPEEEPLTVTASKLSPSIIPSVAAAALPPLATALTPATPASTAPQDTLYTGDEPMITATATKVPTTIVPSVITGATVPALSNALATPDPATTTTPDKKLSVSDYLKIAGLLAPLIPGGGGDKGTAAGNVPGGLGKLNPIFSAKLPTGADVNIPGGVGAASNLAARPVTDEDWLTYGQRPEKSFFNYVPDTPEQYQMALAANAPRPATPDSSVPGTAAMPAGVAPAGGSLNNIAASLLPTLATAVGSPLAGLTFGSLNVDWNKFANSKQAQDLLGQFRAAQNAAPAAPTGMAHGGSLEAKRGGRPSRSSFAVNGPGTGRSDDIPAVLSDGEYVMDAETVALLGDGSSKAGAQKLDDLRVKIRKHKGQRLSQGRFSSDAKKPEAYLTGGRI